MLSNNIFIEYIWGLNPPKLIVYFIFLFKFYTLVCRYISDRIIVLLLYDYQLSTRF